MKNFLLMVTLCLCSVISQATTYYVATTGNDNNPGTINSPFKTLEKLNSVMMAGDIAYIRGGTYRSTAGNGAGEHFSIDGLTGTSSNPIKIWAYPGETPIFNLDDITPTNPYPIGMLLNSSCSYVHLKGFVVKNLKQIASGIGVSRGMSVAASNCTVELFDIFNIGGTGFILDNATNCLILNCDSHHNGDGLSDLGGGSKWDFGDAFTSTDNYSTGCTFRGCRAWMCGDDGWDFFMWRGNTITLDNCWSFWGGVKPWGPNGTQVNEANMTPANSSFFYPGSPYFTAEGVGYGFKLGGCNSGCVAAAPNTTKKFLTNCIAFENSGEGFGANMDAQYSHRMSLLNCISYRNGNDGFGFGTGRSTGIAQIFKNCWAWGNNQLQSGADWVYDGLATNVANNYWESTYMGVNFGNLKSPLSITNVDFVSTSSAGITGARKADGSLPDLTFLKLASSSDLINKGVNVGLSYVSTAPDLGAFEFGVALPVPVTLAGFSATEKTGRTLLQWSTATEINSSHFEVEISIDGRNFEKIGSVNANGNSNTVIDYQLTDNYPQLGVNYYRLKIVDKDGQYEYSRIVSVNFRNNTNTGSFEIKSTVINDQTLQLNVSSSKQQTAILGLYDAAGRLMFSSNITLQKGVNNINKMVMPSSGIYYMKLKTNDALITLPLLKGR